MRTKQSKKVIVAMSGGVDSSVAAALLQRAGFDLVGVFMKFWKAPSDSGLGWNRCCSVEAASRARRVCQKLGIPFYVLNLEKEFKQAVVDYFLREYKAGRTPNPCVVCNKEIKFRFLLKKAMELKADFVATGHYVCCKGAKLLQAKDKTKDQSYFLWKLTQRDLSKLLFPVGDYTKKEVRALAKKIGLPTAETKESQEVCFIQNTTFDFLQKYLKQKPGSIVTKQGEVIGKHQGLWFCTIGQRKGIGLSGGPFYVVAKDLKKNQLIVSKDKKDLEQKELVVKKVNWLAGKAPEGAKKGKGLKVKAQIRYNSSLAPATMFRCRTSKHWKVVFDKPQIAVATGQSVVFYKGQQVLGGGVIR